ncbi:MAG: polyprenyl synthetase family protein [Methanomassiliicoccales archaeon]
MDLMEELERRTEIIAPLLLSYLDRGEHQKLKRAVMHYPEAGGKRLRPVLAHLVADAISGSGERSLPFGCCLEIIHNFTLVHDDVMDQDPVRRGRQAVHVLYDTPTAIIAGDALFARAFEVLAETEVGPEEMRRLLKLVSITVWRIAEGQQMDIDFESQGEVSTSEYLGMIEKKTAVLFSCAAEGGAIVAGGTEEQVESMGEYARLLGISFQIWDDVLGITADQEDLGKPVGSDIRNGKRTLIVLHALENGSREQRSRLKELLGSREASEEEVEEAIDLLEEIGSIEYARNMAMEYVEKARRCLDCLPPSDHREIMDELVIYSAKRKS